MFSYTILVHIFAFLNLISEATSKYNDTIDASTCVDPGGYTACFDQVVTLSATCVKDAADAVQVMGCGCFGYSSQIACAASHCWNRVYGCEYQFLVANYFSLCNVASPPIPYWPAPENAPGGCSCALGLYTQALLNAYETSSECGLAVNNTIKECGCCAKSVEVSAIFDICPDSDPTLLGVNQLTNGSSIWSSCGPSLNSVDCVADLGFEAPLGTGTLYNPTNLPTWGTKTISDLPGGITSPLSGATFTWSNSDAGISTVITAVSVAQGVTLTAGAGTTRTTVSRATGGATGTTAASGIATPIAQKGDGSVVISQSSKLTLVVFLAACAILV